MTSIKAEILKKSVISNIYPEKDLKRKVILNRISKTGVDYEISENIYEKEKEACLRLQAEYLSLKERLDLYKQNLRSERNEKTFLASEKLAINKKRIADIQD